MIKDTSLIKTQQKRDSPLNTFEIMKTHLLTHSGLNVKYPVNFKNKQFDQLSLN